MAFETLLDQETITRFTDAGFWIDKTITDFLDEAAATVPDKVAFVDARRSITYAALRAEVDRCALGLLESGIGPGDVAVSYTHLDVYKRQLVISRHLLGRGFAP